MSDAFRQRVQENDGDFPDSWKPNEGDMLVGHIVKYDEATTDFGTYAIAVVECEDTKKLWSVWLMHTVLKQEFQKHDPKPGERVAIKKLEDGKSERFGSYKRYIVDVDRGPDAKTPDWSKYGSDGSDIPASAVEVPLDEPDDSLPF